MRILHLFSDWKWTGPAEPTVNLCLALRGLGHEVDFACAPAPRHVRQTIAGKARERGLEACQEFHLNRRFGVLEALRDIRCLTHRMDRRRYDLVHLHLSHDHVVGGIAGRRARSRPLLVRTNHKGVPFKPHRGNDFLLRTLADGVIEISPRAAGADCETFALAPERVWTVDGAVDLERFCGGGRREATRAAFGFAPEHVVVGIVARMQRHRRFDVLLEAVRRAVAEFPALRLLVVGRGTHRRAVAERPVRDLGLQDHVVFSGYRSADYVDVLSAIDLKVFLVPGSDGSCRAVREAMSMGKPVIAARRGMLPEIVADGQSGLVIDDTAGTLADALVRLGRDPGLRERMGRAARETARARFALTDQAAAVDRAYRSLAEGRPPVHRLGWCGL